MPTALITGITGQDGSYLAELLLEKGYRVVGLVRRSSSGTPERLRHLLGRIELAPGDLLDLPSLITTLEATRPDEVYNLAAQSFVPASWQQPLLTQDVTAMGVTRLLEAIRLVNRKIRFFQASSSEMFGDARQTPQNESTPFCPRHPYGISKLFAHWMTLNYRHKYDIFAVSGISYNHESPRRGTEFVSRKITRTAAKIKLGLASELRLGSLDSRRDWGFAGDFVRGMWLMLNRSQAEDFVLATGVLHSVQDVVEAAFSRVGLEWREYVRQDEQFSRAPEVNELRGDATRARERLAWEPRVDFKSMIEMMVDADLEDLARPQILKIS